jgi:hypothetical protein
MPAETSPKICEFHDSRLLSLNVEHPTSVRLSFAELPVYFATSENLTYDVWLCDATLELFNLGEVQLNLAEPFEFLSRVYDVDFVVSGNETYDRTNVALLKGINCELFTLTLATGLRSSIEAREARLTIVRRVRFLEQFVSRG